MKNTFNTRFLERGAMYAMVRSIIESPHGNREWSVQGFGMLRTYLDDAHMWRLNIWDSALAVNLVSLIHDHPWHFKSWVIAGKITNLRYAEHAPGQNGPLEEPRWYAWALIVPGPGGGPVIGGSGAQRLWELDPITYRAGDEYEQKRDEIHKTLYTDGAVTLNYRYGRQDQDLARVFWEPGKKWVDAMPRSAKIAEIARTCEKALAVFPKSPPKHP